MVWWTPSKGKFTCLNPCVSWCLECPLQVMSVELDCSCFVSCQTILLPLLCNDLLMDLHWWFGSFSSLHSLLYFCLDTSPMAHSDCWNLFLAVEKWMRTPWSNCNSSIALFIWNLKYFFISLGQVKWAWKLTYMNIKE